MAFNNWPYEGTAYHFLFIHRAHIETTEAITPKGWAEFYALYKKVAKKFKLRGVSLLMRSGDMQLTGATVHHLHAQLIVGKKRGKDTEVIRAVVGFKKKK